jgi:hypothetical protein
MDSLRRRPVYRIMRPAGVFILAFFLFGCDNTYHDLVQSNENRITSFEIDGQIDIAVIDSNTISVRVEEGTDLTNVIPLISVSKGARLLEPERNIAIDLSVQVDFLVMSARGTVRKYTCIAVFEETGDETDVIVITTVKSVSAGSQHYSMTIKTDGSLWAWGNNAK